MNLFCYLSFLLLGSVLASSRKLKLNTFGFNELNERLDDQIEIIGHWGVRVRTFTPSSFRNELVSRIISKTTSFDESKEDWNPKTVYRELTKAIANAYKLPASFGRLVTSISDEELMSQMDIHLYYAFRMLHSIKEDHYKLQLKLLASDFYELY